MLPMLLRDMGTFSRYGPQKWAEEFQACSYVMASQYEHHHQFLMANLLTSAYKQNETD